jgi:sialic acid synthase SpsE/RimJ/RimL family protein N-acetyltransferase
MMVTKPDGNIETSAGENDLSLEIVPQNEQAARIVMEWRNNEESRSNSFDTTEKKWPSFYQEFCDQYFEDPSLPALFVLRAGKRVALLRFRRLNDLFDGKRASDISINVAPEARGTGVAFKGITQCIPTLRNGQIDVLVADVKPTNEPSISLFGKLGFSLHGEIDYKPGHLDYHVRVKRFFLNLTSQMVAGGRFIGPGHPCFVIAEAGSNWRMGTSARDLKMAKALIDVAVEAGADAVKFQTYQPSTTYVENAGTSDYLSDSGIQESITDIFQDLAMPIELLPKLAEYSESQGIMFMSSPFSVADFRAVDPFVQMHKIASYEVSHIRLIEAIAGSNKPTFMSTGACEIPDIEWAVKLFQSISSSQLCLMQCTARYPAGFGNLNLGTISLLKAKFGLPVGLSDHTRDPIIGPVTAVALGANCIEKHYTLDNRLPGPDHAFAITASELKLMVDGIRNAEQVVGSGKKHVLEEEVELFWYARRGLQAIKEIGVGDRFVESVNFDILRPGKQKRGVHPQQIERVKLSKAKRTIAVGDGIQVGDFD